MSYKKLDFSKVKSPTPAKERGSAQGQRGGDASEQQDTPTGSGVSAKRPRIKIPPLASDTVETGSDNVSKAVKDQDAQKSATPGKSVQQSEQQGETEHTPQEQQSSGSTAGIFKKPFTQPDADGARDAAQGENGALEREKRGESPIEKRSQQDTRAKERAPRSNANDSQQRVQEKNSGSQSSKTSPHTPDGASQNVSSRSSRTPETSTQKSSQQSVQKNVDTVHTSGHTPQSTTRRARSGGAAQGERATSGSAAQHTRRGKDSVQAQQEQDIERVEQSSVPGQHTPQGMSPMWDALDTAPVQDNISTPVESPEDEHDPAVSDAYATGVPEFDEDYIDPFIVDHSTEHIASTEDDSAPFTGFQNMLEDLLDDDEFDVESGSERDAAQGELGVSASGREQRQAPGEDNASASAPQIENPFLDDDSDDVADDAARDQLLDNVVEHAGNRYSARDAFPEEYEKRRARQEILQPLRDAGAERYRAEVREWEAEQGIEEKTQKPRSKTHVQFAQKYDKRPVTDVTLDASGVPEEYVARVERQEQPRQRYKYFSKDKRMNTAEMRFFRETRKRKSEALRSLELAERLLPPVGVQESEKDFRARARRITRALEGRDAYKKGARSTFGVKEQDTLQFLAMFRYATASHISRMFSEARRTAEYRLEKLRSYGLVINRAIFGTEDLWILTDAGMLLSGMELVRTTDARLTFSMFPHQFTVNHVAANLWGAGLNVLGLADYPQYHRTNLRGETVPGEQLVSELQIQSSFTKQRAFGAAHVFRPQIIEQIDAAFRKWETAGGVEFGDSPELHEGNEYMWTILPPTRHRHAYHVPDLVVKRPRAADGSPRSLAVEIEIYNKPQESYERTLRAYDSDRRLYEQVIWVCKGVGSARKLEKAAKKIGLLQEGRISIVPILTEDGVFHGKNLWLI